MSSIVSQTEQDIKSLVELQCSCCNILLDKAVTLSCGHKLCNKCFWETASKSTIKDCIAVKCHMCGAKDETAVVKFPCQSQFTNLQSAEKSQYFTVCETHRSQFKIYFCSDHGEALCTDCMLKHKKQKCNTEPIENKIKQEKKYADDIFSDQRFKNVAECLCSVDDAEILLDLFFFKMKKRIHDCKEKLAQELGISMQNQEIIKQLHDDVKRTDQMVSHNIFTHNILDELLRIKNAHGALMYNLKLSENTESWPPFVVNKSKDFDQVLTYDDDPIQLSPADLSVYQSSSCVEDEEDKPSEASDNNALQRNTNSAMLRKTNDYVSDDLNEVDMEYDNSFDASDDNDDGNYDYDDDDDGKEEEKIEEDIEDVPVIVKPYSSTRDHDVSLPNQAIAEQLKPQSNRTPRKLGGMLISVDYRRKAEYSSGSDTLRENYGTSTDKSISNRDSDSAASISRPRDDGSKESTSLFKVITAPSMSSTTGIDIVTHNRQSTSGQNDAATYGYQAQSSKFSETNTQRPTTSDSRTKRNDYTSSSTDSLHSSIKCEPQGGIQSAIETLSITKLPPSSVSSIIAVDTDLTNQTRITSPSDHTTSTTERSQQHLVLEPTSPTNFPPGMEIRSQLPRMKEDFTVEQCIGFVISDRFILTSNKTKLQKRRFEDSILLEDTELSNMTSLCVVPSDGEISVLQTKKSIRIYSAAKSRWHFKTDINLPYQSICCWKVDKIDTWKTYVFVVSYTNDIRQDCIQMVTISHDCSFPKSDKLCECKPGRYSVLLTSETSPYIRGVSSLDVMRDKQQLLMISAIKGLVCATVSEDSAEILWECPFRTNISRIACDDKYVYVCVPNEKRVAKVSKNGQIIQVNILPTEIVADSIAVKDNTVLVGSFYHCDWTYKVYRVTF